MSEIALRVDPHPLLGLRAFTTAFATPLGETTTPESIQALLREDAEAPSERDEACRQAVRDLLRHGGYKPTGRGKPSSEYLVRAASESALGSINLAVDACNAASLHSGLPISVVDVDRLVGSARVAIAEKGTSYVFNASGQEIDVGGLLCLFDEEGPCANAVKDAQRTKTSAPTRATLTLIWAPATEEARAARAEAWYRDLLERAGARTSSTRIST